MRLSFRRLRKSGLLVFDTYRSDILISVIVKSDSYLGLQTRVNDGRLFVYISSSSIIYLVNFFILKSKYYFPNSISKRLVLSYYSSVIKICGASEVLSLYGSNSIYFSNLTKIHSDVLFKAYITHQIHMRHLLTISTERNCRYFVLGDYDREQLTSLCVQDKNIETIGSLYSKEFYKSLQKIRHTKKYDIMLISQYQHFWEHENCSEIRLIAKNIFDKMMEYLVNFLSEMPNVNVVIAFRPQPSHEAERMEFDYFEAYFKNNKKVIYGNRKNSNLGSYDLLMESRVVLTHYSTLAFEAFAFDKKVLFCQFYDYSSKFRIPDDISNVCRSANYEIFKVKLNHLLQDRREDNTTLQYMKTRYNNI